MSRRMWSLVFALTSIGSTCTHPAPDGGMCVRDDDCTTNAVCARDGRCWRASRVRMVHLTWTLRSQPATAQTCAATPELEILFQGTEEPFGFAQVSCVAGMFTVDKLPDAYTRVGLGRPGDPPTFTDFDAAGTAVIDLR